MSLLRIRVSVLGFQYKVENSHNMFSCIISVSFRKRLSFSVSGPSARAFKMLLGKIRNTSNSDLSSPN